MKIGTSLIRIDLSWTQLKEVISSKSLRVQFEETTSIYQIFCVEEAIVYLCVIYKGTVPPESHVDQQQNDLDKSEFESDYKSGANLPLVPKSADGTPITVVSTKVDCVPLSEFLKNGTNSAMNVNGSSSPIEFKVVGSTGYIWHVASLQFILTGKFLNIDSKDQHRFGEASKNPLDNGLLANTYQQGEEGVIFADAVKTLGGFIPYVSDILNLNNYAGSLDMFRATIQFSVPVALYEPSDKVCVVVQDDLRDLETFTCLAVGHREKL